MQPLKLLLFIFIPFQALCQEKFETRIGLSYVVSIYDQQTPGLSDYLESKNGPGLKISEEYYFTPYLSVIAGVNVVNTNVSFDTDYIVGGATTEIYRHHLKLMELDIQAGLKFSPLTDNSLRWFSEIGVEYRTSPYGFATVNDLTGSRINRGRADFRMFDSPLAPFFCIGLDYKQPGNKLGYFLEANYQYLIGRYFYGGNKNDAWLSDVLINCNHFISFSGGIKF